jgi:orotidine-5'-phosphate decarboxylase
VIAPATRPGRISEIRKIVGQLLILAPGVGAQGGSAADAIRAGADYVIVGRSIYASPDPAKAARGISEEVRSVLKK